MIYLSTGVVKTCASFFVFPLQKGSTGPAYAGNNTFTSWMNIKLSDHMSKCQGKINSFGQ
jgi:hypothetical protein